ncbi:hypothetical protein BGZ60DRAFT_404510 [Tricladium varicosporioides]|nr:hypothetical protein BGZ60DRAFT_404510 [Hymenoscyphus varicosporioides]
MSLILVTSQVDEFISHTLITDSYPRFLYIEDFDLLSIQAHSVANCFQVIRGK